MGDGKRWLSGREVMRRLNVCHSRLMALANQGYLDLLQVPGANTRYSAASVARLEERCTVRAREEATTLTAG